MRPETASCLGGGWNKDQHHADAAATPAEIRTVSRRGSEPDLTRAFQAACNAAPARTTSMTSSDKASHLQPQAEHTSVATISSSGRTAKRSVGGICLSFLPAVSCLPGEGPSGNDVDHVVLAAEAIRASQRVVGVVVHSPSTQKRYS